MRDDHQLYLAIAQRALRSGLLALRRDGLAEAAGTTAERFIRWRPAGRPGEPTNWQADSSCELQPGRRAAASLAVEASRQ
jgi:hypothetical protein